MLRYAPPLKDFQFVLHDVLRVTERYPALAPLAETNRELIDSILEEAGKFTAQVLAPLNQSGDAEGCRWDAGHVHTPAGFKAAFETFSANGWSGLVGSSAHGGMGQPYAIGAALVEMMASSNMAWSMYPGLSHGAAECIHANGDDWQRDVFERAINEGRWTGTMCLTEPHCGSDLGLLKSKAEPAGDGSYRISGTKIFISAGEHDLAENIIHLVLARLPDAPGGTKGISMFIVPKFKVDQNGQLGERNAMSCGSIEHKMGIKASATCVMNFDGATGWMIGPPNRGLNAMFVMMNTARLEVGIQGQALIEASFQNALPYARERLQMRALSGPKRPDKPADPIIVHPDVRRMLLTQKAIAEAGRAQCLYSAHLVDETRHAPTPEERQHADELLSFFTPITKGFLTEMAVECTSHGMQVLGGHGYIREWGLEQLLRDARITTIYEGTTQIQALDLLGRKIVQTQGVGFKHFLKLLVELIGSLRAHPQLTYAADALAARAKQWPESTIDLGRRAIANPDEIGAAAVDYLMYSGYVVHGYWWARMALVAQAQPASEFHQAKLHTAKFYFERLLPRCDAHLAAMKAAPDSLLALPEALFQVA
jgi:alkylation response protein AidB-like acyl-CoA dehydrogenase